jgi:protein-S-isoprenylcysteine O-methyltransferase Ste14
MGRAIGSSGNQLGGAAGLAGPTGFGEFEMKRRQLNKRALGGLLRTISFLSASLFLPAWTLDYWQAWIFLTVFSASTLAITIYLMKNDPKLLDRRLEAGPGAEPQRSQKIIQVLAAVAFVGIFVVCATDHRFTWSSVPLYAVAAGDILVALGLFMVFLVFKENTFTAAIVQVEAEQTLISKGPYALVRHPMYAGALVMLLGVPVALGSWWGLFTIVPITLVIVWRLLDEENLLATNLPGYAEYTSAVRYRLVPFVW